MENPALGGASTSLAGELDDRKHTAPKFNVQDTLDKAMRHAWPVSALGSILALHLPWRQRVLLAAGTLHSIDLESCEELAEVVLHDLREGDPPPPFGTLRHEADSWAMFASPAERKFYLAAIWRELPSKDRRRFLKQVL